MTNKMTAPRTKPPISVGLIFLFMLFLFSASQETAHRRILRMGQKLLRVAAGDHGSRFRVEKHAVVADGKNARQLMGDNHHRRAQAVAQLQDKIVEQARADRIEASRRFVEK